MDGKLWGGFLDNSSNFTSPFLLSFDDVEKLSKAEFVPANRNLNAESAMTTQMMPISYFDADPIIKHNIQLVQYSKQMEELLQQLQNSYMKTSSDSIPPVPVMQSKQHIPQDPNIKLTRRGVQQLLHKSAFTICAHEGFDRTSESVLATLVDVAEEMLEKFCKLLKVNTEREILNQSTGFTDAMERTLHDVGMSGVKDLHFFHVNRVLRYNDRLRSQAENLRRACVKAASQWDGGSSKPGGPTTPWEDPEFADWSGNEAQETDFSFKREPIMSRHESTSSEAVNQLHLEDNAVISAPGLEPGLRMLHTLEQQEACGSNSGRLPHLILMEEDSSVSPANYASVESSTSPAVSFHLGKNGDGKKKRKP